MFIPFPSEHSARLRSPSGFDPQSFRRTNGGSVTIKDAGKIEVPATISIIWGKLKGKSGEDDPVLVQALRFPIKDWTEDQAKAWLKKNNIKTIVFEPATGTKESLPTLIAIDAEHIVERLKNGEDVIILSSVDRTQRTEKDHALVEGKKVWAVVSLHQEPDIILDFKSLGESVLGLDKLSREEFPERRGSFYLIKLTLEEEFDEPIELIESPSGERFGSDIDISRFYGTKKLGAYIEKMILKNHESIMAFAKSMSMAPSTIGAIVRGEVKSPPDNCLESIAKALGISSNKLISMRDEASGESLTEQDLPKSSLDLTVPETFEKIMGMGRLFTQEESGYAIPSKTAKVACGPCRFYLRNPDGSPMGRCQVVEGEIAWFATCDLFIGALEEAKAVFDMEEDEEPAIPYA